MNLAVNFICLPKLQFSAELHMPHSGVLAFHMSGGFAPVGNLTADKAALRHTKLLENIRI